MASIMASNNSYYEAKVHSCLEIALKEVAGRDFKIKELQKKQFFDNLIIKAVNFGEVHFFQKRSELPQH